MGLRQEGGKTLITPSGGSGGNTTIDAPLGSQPAANSVSVALASDQLPLPVLASIDTTGLATDSNQITEIARLTSILAQLDVALSTIASETTLSSVLGQLDVNLSTRASETTLATLLTTSSFESRINSLGQKTSASSTPVVIASDQSVVPVSGPLTNTELRAVPVPISGSVIISGTVDVTEPVTVDAVNLDIRDLVFATDKVDVSGSTGVGVTGPLTDTQLRATPVPVSGSVTVSGTVSVNQPVTVQATDLDIRNLVFATDKVDASGSSVSITKTDLTPSAPTAASVGVASAQILASNANRKGLILVNTSVNRISLGFGSTAVLDSGPTLYPQGSFNMGEYDFDTGAVNAIASAASSNIAIQEYA